LRQAYERCPALHRTFDLVCCGGGPPRSGERAAAGRTWFEQADDNRLATLYHHAAAFVYPSLAEGFGLPLLEAMHHGAPVVTTRCGAIPEVAADAAAYAAGTDADALAEAIRGVVEHPQRAEALRQRGARRVRDFSWDTCAAAHVDLYRQVMGWPC
jgi:glycosyltransferase involved in cell wall biosynthesis